MKGIVFTELIEMVEDKWGLAVVDQLLEPEGLSSGGIYTAVGTYDDRDVGVILGRLSAATGISGGDLQRHFGGYMFGSFSRAYSDMLSDIHSTFGLLARLDDFIHPEVQKLYPDATLPGFEVIHRDDTRMEMHYRSQRRMPEFAEGLIRASGVHFKEDITIDWEVLDEASGLFRFLVEKKN